MTDNRKGEKKYFAPNFEKFWRFVPANRFQKELLKTLLFSVFPGLFRDWAIFQNWKNSRAFAPQRQSLTSSNFWRRFFSGSYRINIKLSQSKMDDPIEKESFGVAIHAFHLDVFSEIINRLRKSDCTNLALYVTTPLANYEQTAQILKDTSFRYRIKIVNNHGRDILPFFLILPDMINDGCKIILKLHTKKSNHLKRKQLWLDDLLDSLIEPGAIKRNIGILNQYPDLGIIGPAGHILPMHLYYGANALRVRSLSNAMGLKVHTLKDLNFVAGSMFYARKEALLPIANLNLTDNDFEEESNQTDGTMAHAVERAFSAGLIAASLQLADTNFDPVHPYYTVSKAHYFSM